MSQIEIAHLTYNFLKKTNMQSKFIKRLLNYKKSKQKLQQKHEGKY